MRWRGVHNIGSFNRSERLDATTKTCPLLSSGLQRFEWPLIVHVASKAMIRPACPESINALPFVSNSPPLCVSVPLSKFFWQANSNKIIHLLCNSTTCLMTQIPFTSMPGAIASWISTWLSSIRMVCSEWCRVRPRIFISIIFKGLHSILRAPLRHPRTHPQQAEDLRMTVSFFVCHYAVSLNIATRSVNSSASPSETVDW